MSIHLANVETIVADSLPIESFFRDDIFCIPSKLS